MSAQRGYPSQQKLERTPIQFVTVEPVHKEQNGASVVAHQYVYQVGTDAAEAGSTVGKIVATAHAALEGDVIRLTSGAQSGKEIKVVSVSADEINLAEDLPAAIATGITFQILRHKYPTVTATGEVNVSGTFSEVATAADGGALPAVVKVVAGYDGSNVQVLKTDSNGGLEVNVVSSALPLNAATEPTLSSIDSKLSVLNTNVIACDTTDVTISSSALPSGAATESTLSDIKTAVELIDDAISGNEMQVDLVNSIGTLDNNNSTTVVLGAGASFTGGWTIIKDFASIQVGIYSDVDSATNGVKAEFSWDGVSVHHTHTYTFLSASNGIGYLFQPEFRYFRLVYTNGATLQASFKLLTTLRPVALFPSQYRVSTPVTNETQALMTKSTIVGASTAGGGTFVAVKVNPSGALTVEADVTASVLPTGAATETTLSALNGKVPANLTVSSTRLLVDGSGVTQPVSGPLTDTELRASAVPVSAASLPLPSGAATEATLGDIKTSVQLLDNAVSGNELQVDVVAALPAGSNTIGKVDVNTLSVVDLLDAGILDTSSTNIAGSSSNPTQVVSSLAAAVKKLQLLDTTGAFIGVYTGAALSEVLQFVMGPGSDQTIEHSIPAGTRISLKRLDSTTAVSSGIVAINFIG